MLFSSPIFLLVFLPLVLLVYYLPLRGCRVAQNVFLLLASLGFYAWGEPWFVLVMLGSIAVNWLLGLWMGQTVAGTRPRRLATFLTAAFNLSILFIFKYLTFTLSSLRAALGAGFAVPQIALPIGISFFTFQAMSYVLDIGRGRAPAQKNPLWVGLYISFFPQLIAGPIVKYETVAAEIRTGAKIGMIFRREPAGCGWFAKRCCLRTRLRLPQTRLLARRGCQLGWLGWARLRTASRFFLIFPAIRTWRSGWGKCSVSTSSRTSITLTFREA